MSDIPIWFVGNRDPSISETITSDGAVIDLNGKTVKFKMRALGATTTKVDQPAVIVTPPGTDGKVRYDWAAGDVDTAGQFLVWWEVTSGTKKQDMNEALVEFRAHAPETNAYVELEAFKATLSLTGQSFADRDAKDALAAASRAVDLLTGQRFYLDADAAQIRYYTSPGYEASRAVVYGGVGHHYGRRDRTHQALVVDPIVELTSLDVAPDSSGAFSQNWTAGTDFVLEPRNAPADGMPYRRIRLLPAGRYPWPGYPNSIRVTGRFGWATVPAGVREATTLIAARMFKEAREAPWGVVGFDEQGAVRVSRQIPSLALTLGPYMKRRLFV